MNRCQTKLSLAADISFLLRIFSEADYFAILYLSVTLDSSVCVILASLTEPHGKQDEPKSLWEQLY